jgi:hypothetical protein
MKIIFICSCLEPGKDGVGDYTRKLAGALIGRGYHSAIIAIYDGRLSTDSWQGKQWDNGTAVDVLRISPALSWKNRLQLIKQYIDAFRPVWLSLQYVPFGFQIKGLPFLLPGRLKKLSRQHRWNIMFHELSVNKHESLKFKLWALAQEKIIQLLVKTLQPDFVTTNTELYRLRLQQMGAATHVIPVFSNIPCIAHVNDMAEKNIIPGYLLNNRHQYTIGTLFGSFTYKNWDLKSLLNKFSKNSQPKKLVIASIGKMSSGYTYWKTLEKEFPDIIFLTLGIQQADFISYWLSYYTDFGILTTLPELSGKSGSYMAFKEHGIPVLCREPEEQLKKYNIPLDEYLTVVTNDESLLTIPGKFAPVLLLNNAVDQFITLLNS